MSSNPFAELEITASSKGLNAKLNEARGKVASWAKSMKGAASDALKGFGGGLGKLGGGALKGFGFGGVAGLGMQATSSITSFLKDGFDSAMNFERSLTRLQITAGRTPEQMEAFRKAVRASSRETGIGSNEIAEAAEKFVGLTGDMAGAEKQAGVWARIAQASSSSVGDIATLSASLSQTMGILPDQTEAAFSSLIIQGKAGAVELRDMASLLSGLAPQYAQFKGGSGLGGLREMGAEFQVIRHGFGSAEEAATGFRSLLTQVVQHADKLHKAGVNIFDKDPKTGHKRLKNFHDIIVAITQSKLMNDPTKLQKALGREEAHRAFLQLQDNLGLYNQLYQQASDTGAVQRDFAAKMASPAAKWDAAMNRMKETMAEAFTPERIEKFAHVLEFAVDKAAALVGAMEKVGTILGMYLGDDEEMDRHNEAMGANAFDIRTNETAMMMAKAVKYDPALLARNAQQLLGAKGVLGTGISSSNAVGEKLMERAIEGVMVSHNPLFAGAARRAGQVLVGHGLSSVIGSGALDGRAAAALIQIAEVITRGHLEVKVGGETVVKAHREAARGRRPGG